MLTEEVKLSLFDSQEEVRPQRPQNPLAILLSLQVLLDLLHGHILMDQLKEDLFVLGVEEEEVLEVWIIAHLR